MDIIQDNINTDNDNENIQDIKIYKKRGRKPKLKTDQEIESVTHIDGNSVRPSRGSLVKMRLVIDSGRTRPNAKGNNCIVWIAVDEGAML